MRRLHGRVVLASHNAGKVREFHALMAPFGIELVSAGALGLPEPEETGSTFEANALLKARAAAHAAGLPALSDDSGFSLEALGGAPDIYSARWAAPSKDFAVAMRKVEAALQARRATTPEARRAWFTCVLAIAWPDGDAVAFRGEVHGTAVWPPRGEHGFGYDPVFVPDGGTRTFGEMTPEAKDAISHRAQAFAKLKAACLD
ncbi:RdgB/HAM1 family non-canonical purine NTP pyrophosphatase [Zavarzinia sp. CC-PAN008]|uniref:RdgB/HAM1 family non-canonical purine NTP pyrophosphatase n=1 Tax=Zavarzinia sp. CC-PAN008 TaxID=3243332 RepID=UPI003F749F49